jgi:hypothetical protein
MTMLEDAHTSLETESTVSETSAAIVSVYNSWSTTSESISFFNDDTLLLDSDRFASLPEREPIDSDELLQELKKRCREEDIPPVPVLRRRRRPACQFLNFMGSRRYKDNDAKYTGNAFSGFHPPLMVFELPCSHDLDLGFEEKDALFPLFSSKAKHEDDGCPEMKKPRLESSHNDGRNESGALAAAGCQSSCKA